MSKYVKDLMVKELAGKLEGVEDALLVNVVGMDSNSSVVMRKELREKDIKLVVIKNSLARRATEGTPLAKAFDEAEGSLALVWGAEDFVSLAKEITRLNDDEGRESFVTRGGVMDGERLTPERVKEISKWPSRAEQLSMLVGQILGPGSTLSGAMLGPGRKLCGQIKSKSEGDE